MQHARHLLLLLLLGVGQHRIVQQLAPSLTRLPLLEKNLLSANIDVDATWQQRESINVVIIGFSFASQVVLDRYKGLFFTWRTPLGGRKKNDDISTFIATPNFLSLAKEFFKTTRLAQSSVTAQFQALRKNLKMVLFASCQISTMITPKGTSRQLAARRRNSPEQRFPFRHLFDSTIRCSRKKYRSDGAILKRPLRSPKLPRCRSVGLRRLEKGD